VFSSCAIHNKFPFICFVPECIKGQFDMKPFRKKMQIAMVGKKRKFKMSFSNSKNSKNKNSYSKNDNSKKVTSIDSLAKDSTIIEEYPSSGSLAILDTVVKIYYQDLTDSLLNKHKEFIKSFIKRIGAKHISEISLTDFYSVEGHDSKSIKSVIANYITNTGVSKHRLFWRKSKRIRLEDSNKKSKNLLYLEIHFY
jgi:hypothetical protein